MGIALTIVLLGGVACSAIASAKRRSFLAWLVIGMLFPLIGLILILALPAGSLDLSCGGPDLAPEPGPYQEANAARVAQRARVQLDALDAIERLVQLKDRGAISESELAEKQAELLARI